MAFWGQYTLEVLAQTIEPAATTSAGSVVTGWPPPEHRAQVAAVLAEPLADELTRGEALRWGALLHDVAKPLTRRVRPSDGRVTFIGHDSLGAGVAREILERLRASERLRAHVAALVRHHLTLGFLVHEPQPLARRSVFAYLSQCAPVEVDVTLLSVADRLATRGEGARQSIDFMAYIWEDGRFSDMLLAHLARKVKAGIEVRIALDGYGSIRAPWKKLADFERVAGRCERVVSRSPVVLGRPP